MLPPAYHALLVAAHSWRHGPLSQLRDMIDVVVMAEAAGRDSVSALAREWGVERLWRSTIRAADAAVLGAEWPTGLRLWARNLERVRERTVFENHATRWLSDFWIMPPRAARSPARDARAGAQPREREPWRAKLTRTGAVRNASVRRSSTTIRCDATSEDARLDIDLGFRERAPSVRCRGSPYPPASGASTPTSRAARGARSPDAPL